MKKTIKYLVILFLLMVLPMRVNALENLTLNVDKTELKKGETLTVTIDLKHDDSLYAFTTGISFDENVFEIPEIQNFKEQGEWSDIVYNKDNNKFALINKSGVVNDHLLVIKLFVKENPVGGTTKISLHNAVASDGEKDISFDDVSKDLTVKGTTNDASTYAPKEDVVENEKSVKTFKSFIIVGLVVIGLLLVGIIFINTSISEKMKFSKKMKKNKINKYLSIALLIALLITIVLMLLQGSKGDVNDDGKKDYEDAKKINEYLIDIQNEKDNKTSKDKTDKKEVDKKKYDVNGDGKITITDTAQRVEETTKTKYTVKLTQDKFKKYPNKKESIKLQFTAKISPDNNLQIKEVYLDGKKVKVSLEDNIYSLTVKTPNTSGIKKYTITKVVLTNGREIDNKDLTFTVDVLKDVPELENFNYNIENHKLTFNIADSDKAFKSAYIKIIKGEASVEDFKEEDSFEVIPDDSENEEEKEESKADDFEDKEVVYEKSVESTKFSDDVTLDLGETYTVLVTGSYDLDTNKLDSKSNYYEDKELYFSNFTTGNITVKPITNFEEIYPKQGENISFEFDALIEPEFLAEQRVAKVIIDGEEVDVEYFEDNYVINIASSNSPGEKIHTISAVILSDESKVLCNYDIRYEVLKQEPKYVDFMYHETNKVDQGRITFSLEDIDQAITGAKLTITDKENNNSIFEQELENERTYYSYVVDNLKKGSTYDAEIVASYDLDQERDNDKNDTTAQFNHELIIFELKLDTVSETYYAEKGKDVELKFKATMTTGNKVGNSVVTDVVINDEVYHPTKYEDYYSIKLDPVDESGIKNYKITKVILDGDEEVRKELTFNVDVLKETPKVENLYIDESDGDNPTITFDLIDEDSALDENVGTIVFKNREGKQLSVAIPSELKSKSIAIPKEVLTGGYSFDIKLNYNLDSVKNDDGYKHEEEVIYEDKEIIIYNNVNLKLNSNNLYFKKGETKTLNINATIEPTAVIKSIIMKDGKEVKVQEKNGNYYLNVTAPSEIAKEYSYEISKVILDNDVKVSAPLPFTIDVLKDVPYVNQLNLNDNNESLSYEIVDVDNAFIGGNISIYDVDNDLIKELSYSDIENRIVFEYPEDKLKDDSVYNIKIKGTYNLYSDESEKPEDEYYFRDKEMYNHSFTIGGDYNFTLTDVNITDALQKDELPVISFVSTNTKGEKVKQVTLNGDSYDVTNVSGNNYQVILDKAIMNPGEHQVTFDSVLLAKKSYSNNEGYTVNPLTYTVLKDVPKVTDIKLTNNSSNKTVTASYTLIDDNNSIVNLAAVLVDTSNNIIDTKEILSSSVNNLNKNITLSYDKNTDGKYLVKFLADYDLGEKYKFTSKNIGENEIFTQNDQIYIQNITLKNNLKLSNPKYVTKGLKNYEISYDVYVGSNIKTNNNKNYSRVSGITINGVDYVASQESGYKSKVAITAPDKAGVLTLNANRVQLELNSYYDKQTNYYSVPDNSIKIEVLKDAPIVKNLQIVEEDANNKTVTFEFDIVDPDESFIDGTIELNGISQEVKRDHNKIEFTEVSDEDIVLSIKAHYDLDTDALNENGKDENEYTNVIYSAPYKLSNEYDLNITEGEAISKNNDNYFEKNEKIKLNFNITGLSEDLNAKKVIIDDKEYVLTTNKNNKYEVIVDGYNTFGKKDIKITGIVLSNGKKVVLSKPCTISLEILKDVPQISDYKYSVTDDEITVSYKVKDSDGAIIDGLPLTITDEDGNEIEYKTTEDNTIEITRDKDILRYYLTIISNFDRDTDVSKNSANYNGDVLFLNEIISLDKNNIELKEITNINLYKIDTEKNDSILVNKVKISDLEEHLENYFVEVEMANMPSAISKIKRISTEDNVLVLVLNYKYVTSKNTKVVQEISVEFGPIENGIATNNTHPDDSFKALLADLEAGKNVTLNRDYDLSNIKIDGATYVTADFKGTLDGKGHTIKNLSKPLFNNIDGGKVSNLVLKNITLTSNGKGGLANVASASQIINVIVDSLTKTGDSGGQNGGLVGRAENNTKIESCGAKNIDIRIGMDQQNGALVGCLHTSSINNSYAIGKVSGSWNFNGGFIGNVQNGTMISNSYAKVTVSGNISCDFACSYNSSGTYQNIISLGSGGNQDIITGTLKNSSNNYYLSDSKTIKDGTKISEDAVNKYLFNDQAGFDSKVWNLDNVSYDNLPVFQFEKSSVLSDISSSDYNEKNENLYNNLLKFTPFYDSNKIISEAKKIDDELLINKEIVHVVPIDKTGNIVTYLTKDDVKKITKVKVVYKTGEHKEYKVIYDNTYDMIASYRVPDLKIDYNFRHYIIDNNSQVVNNLTNYLEGLDYTENLDVLTSTADSRIYRDFYNDVTSKELKEFVLKYLSNSNYTNTTDDAKINAHIEKSVKENKKIEKVLYMYNYFRRFYDLNIDGMKLYDFMMFSMDGFDSSLTPARIADLYLADGNNFSTASTGTKYEAILGNYTHKDKISKFLEYMVTVFGDGDLDEWTRQQFKGYLCEIKIDGHDEIQYTLWDHFINEDKSYPGRAYDMVLPILTLPKNAAYIISSPVQFIIGAQRTYIENPDDPKDHAELERRVAMYAERMKKYYTAAYGILGDATLFNNIHTMHHDKRYAYDENGAKVYQQVGTEEPFHKNFNEVTGRWQTSDGNNAVAWGDRIDWSVAGLLDSELAKDTFDNGHVTYKTWSHESAHNIDARLFLKNHGRRFDAGGEDYADSVFMQSFSENEIVMNLSIDFKKDLDVGSSLSPERIDTQSEIYDFYNKVFQTIYVMDYIEAQAFLQLTPEQQAEIGIQVSYPNENKYTDVGNRYRARLVTGLSQKDAKDWENMKLSSINDLIDKKIILAPGIYKYSSRGSNLYGGEGIITVHWYQPNNPYGRPDSYAMKWFAYEMLGYKGYDNGFVEYNSNIHATTAQISNDIDHPEKGKKTINNYKTDNMAIQRISGGLYSNIDQYKKARFEETGEKLKYLNSEIDVTEYTQKFYEALVADAVQMKTAVDKRLGADRSNETSCLNDYWCSRYLQGDRSYPNSTKVRQEIYHTLKKLTDDFTQEIFAEEVQQANINFQVKKESQVTEDINLLDVPVVIDDLLKDSNTIEEGEESNFQEDEYTSDGDDPKEQDEEYVNKIEDTENKPKEDEYIGSDGDPKTESSSPEEVENDDFLEEQENSKEEIVEDSIDSVEEEKKEVPEEETSSETNSEEPNDLETDSLVEEDLSQ